MDEKKFEILYDHYKETNQLRLEAQKQRNEFFIICCVLEAFSFLFVVRTVMSMSVFQNIIKESFGIETAIGNNLVQTVLWILIAYFLIRYIQNTLFIERQYGYQDQLEKKLNEASKNNLFSREGEEYLKNYPNSLNLIDVFYKCISPCLLFIINIYRIITECKVFGWNTFIDLIICISIEVILWAFFFDIHAGISGWCRNHLPGFRWLADKIRAILKKV